MPADRTGGDPADMRPPDAPPDREPPHQSGPRKLARFVSLLPATKGIRDMLDSLKGGETVEFMGTPREWHDMNGEVCYAVVVKDLRIIPAVKPAYR